MDVTQLAAATATALVPVLPYLLDKTGDVATKEAIKKVGKEAWSIATTIWDRLWPKVKAKEATREAAEDAAKNPGDADALASLRRQLVKLLSEDQSLASEVAQLLEKGRKAGPSVVASGDRSIAIGGDSSGPNITGDNCTIPGRK
jgi:hypothetical protein